MKPIVALSVLAGAGLCLGLGMFMERGLNAVRGAHLSGAGARPAGTEAHSISLEVPAENPPQDAGSFLAGKSPKVGALFASFDRRDPVASQVVVLQKILASSPRDLAEMATSMMSAPKRLDPCWEQAKTDWPDAEKARWLEKVK